MPDLWYDVDAALAEVPVNMMPLIDDTDFKAIEASIAYNATGLALYWHFVTTAGAYSVTAVTPTTGGNYDWTDQGDAGLYTIEIPASGGASINNDTEGFGWFTGVATGVLPWRGPIIGFRAAALNNALIDGTTIDVNVTALSGDATAATAGAVADAICDEALSGHTMAGTVGKALSDVLEDTGATIPALLTAGSVTLTAPVSTDGETVTLVQGDDYYLADSRQLSWTDSGSEWPSLTGGSILFTVRNLATGVDYETAGVVSDANTCYVELPAATTVLWPAGGKFRFDLQATLTGTSHKVTLVTGAVVVTAKYSG